MATTRRADATWSGDLLSGRGTVSAATTGLFRDLKTTWASRIGEPEGVTSPEELLAAAHASCFSMAVSNELAKAGTAPTRIAVTVEITADKLETGWTVQSAAIIGSRRRAGRDADQLPGGRRKGEGRLPHLEGPQGQRRAVGRGHAGARLSPFRSADRQQAPRVVDGDRPDLIVRDARLAKPRQERVREVRVAVTAVAAQLGVVADVL